MRWIPGVATIAAACLAASACGGGSEAQDAGARPVDAEVPASTSSVASVTTVARRSSPQMETTVHIEGAVNLDGDYVVSDTLSSNCESVGRSGNIRGMNGQRFEVLLPQLRGGRQTVSVSPSLEAVTLSGFLIASPYTGPATYDREHFGGREGAFSLQIETADEDLSFGILSDSEVVLIVKPDGSGRLDFESLHDAEKKIAGFIEWTCVS